MNAQASREGATLLPDRGVVAVTGTEARKFLNGLLTIEVDSIGPGQSRYGALLTPQGKIIVDFIIAEAPAEVGGGFLLDCPLDLAPQLAQRLGMYKLRAKVEIANRSDAFAVAAISQHASIEAEGIAFPDPRLATLGSRRIVPKTTFSGPVDTPGLAFTSADYDATRIMEGVPKGGVDFAYGDAFPHEANMDQLGGVDFDKGCFVGQEVVARMQHRTAVRTRVVPVRFTGDPPAHRTEVLAGAKSVGVMGSGIPGAGLAMLRLDRVADALAANIPLQCGGVTLTLHQPTWARFAWPGATDAAE